MRKLNETNEAMSESSTPKTLRELGVPGSLAREMELMFELLGHTKGDRITGFSFRTPDGVRHELRSESADVRAADKAA